MFCYFNLHLLKSTSMQKILTTCLFVLSSAWLQAQSVGVGTTDPHSSSLLHINSTTKGILIPSMTGAQRMAIPSPAEGLLVYDLSANRTFQYQNGAWRLFITNEYWAQSATRNWVYNGTDSIGIGNAAPGERLHVSGNIRGTGDLKLGGNAGIGVLLPEQQLHVRSSSSSEGMLLDAVNPIIQLRQSNTPATGYTNKGFIQLSGDNLRIGTNSGNTEGRFIIRNNGGDRLSVDGAGNVNLTGQLTSTATGTEPLLPVCYGVTASVNGGVGRGTAGVSVTRIGLGRYIISHPSFDANTMLFLSGFASNITFGILHSGGTEWTIYVRRTTDGTDVDQNFRFIAY